ncbi:hypothetical protein L249_0659, partial [Ophiocordyceps polyrhachis-furcata BCC 54312]
LPTAIHNRPQKAPSKRSLEDRYKAPIHPAGLVRLTHLPLGVHHLRRRLLLQPGRLGRKLPLLLLVNVVHVTRRRHARALALLVLLVLVLNQLLLLLEHLEPLLVGRRPLGVVHLELHLVEELLRYGGEDADEGVDLVPFRLRALPALLSTSSVDGTPSRSRRSSQVCRSVRIRAGDTLCVRIPRAAHAVCSSDTVKLSTPSKLMALSSRLICRIRCRTWYRSIMSVPNVLRFMYRHIDTSCGRERLSSVTSSRKTLQTRITSSRVGVSPVDRTLRKKLANSSLCAVAALRGRPVSLSVCLRNALTSLRVDRRRLALASFDF